MEVDLDFNFILWIDLPGVSARAAVPSGASTGVYEAVELRDNDPLDHFGKCKQIFALLLLLLLF